MTFYADLPGRHILSFTVNGVKSNQVIIDVAGTYTPNNYLPPRYTNYGYGLSPYYGYGSYPGFFGFGGDEFGEGEGGEFGGEAGEVEGGEAGEVGERGGDRD